MENKIIIEKPLDGWAYDLSSSNSAAVEGGKNQYSRSTAINVFKDGFNGHIGPGETFTRLTDAGTRVNELPLNSAIASNGEVFTVLKNARLVQFGIGDDVVDANYTVTMSGSHAAHTLNTSTENLDAISWVDSSGVSWISWSWEDNTDADIARIKSDGTSQDDDWFSTLTSSAVLTKGVPLKMWIGPDAYLYCTNGRYVAQYTMSTSGFATAFDGGIGWVMSAGCSYQKFSAIGAYKNSTYNTTYALGECRVYLWDGFSPKPLSIFSIPDNYLSALINDNGVLKAFTYGRYGTTKVWAFNGGGFDLISQSALGGSYPRSGSLDIFQSRLVWSANGSDKLMMLDGKALHFRTGVTDSGGSANDVGMVKNLSSNSLYIGYKQSTNYFISKINYSGAYTNADFRTLLYQLPYKSTIKKVTVFFSQFTSASSVICSLFKDYSSISIGGAADLLYTTVSPTLFPNVATDKAVFITKTIPDVSSFYMNFRFNHAQITDTPAIIRAVVIEYEPTAKS